MLQANDGFNGAEKDNDMDLSEELTGSAAAATGVYCKVGVIDVCGWEGVTTALDNVGIGTLVYHGEFVGDGAAGLDSGFDESVYLCAIRGHVDFVCAVSLSLWNGVGSSASDEEDKSGEMHGCWLLDFGM